MYTLEVVRAFELNDGRNFAPGHDCSGLSAFDVAELVANFPDRFKAKDALTQEFIDTHAEFIAKAKNKQLKVKA